MSLDQRLRSLFAATFGIEESRVTDDTSPATVPEWDSLSHLTLVLAIEAEFGVAFEADEIPGLDSFARVRERVAAR